MDESNQDKIVAICKDTNSMEVEGRRLSKIGKCRSRNNKVEYSLDSAADVDGDQPGPGVSTSREEKVSSLKTVSFVNIWFSSLINLLFSLFTCFLYCCISCTFNTMHPIACQMPCDS